jgi:hypothetical protein
MIVDERTSGRHNPHTCICYCDSEEDSICECLDTDEGYYDD